MKKIILILALFLTACAPAFPMQSNSAVCDCATPTVAITATVAPTTTATRTPLPAGTCPATPFYAKVAPLPKTSNAWLVYIPDYPLANPYYYPATIFLQRILNASSWTHDNELINLSSDWLTAFATLDGDSWNSFHNTSNGTFLAGKYADPTFPGATLLITKFVCGCCFCGSERHHLLLA